MKMKAIKRGFRFACHFITFIFIFICFLTEAPAGETGLPEIRKAGVLRHLGVPYANFVTGLGNGMDIELIQHFSRYLNVNYRFVQTTWKNVISDLVGKRILPDGDNVEILQEVPVRGDLIASGLTVLAWRKRVVDYSTPTFPNQVWLIAPADSPLQPIQPSGDTDTDIAAVKSKLPGKTLLGVAGTCLDPSLYGLAETGAIVRLHEGNLNELAPAAINSDSETVILDFPDALIALEKFPGKLKVIGPVSPIQHMGVAFRKTSPKLLEAFNHFFHQFMKKGRYFELVKAYYPAAYSYFPEFFTRKNSQTLNKTDKSQEYR